MGRIQANRDLIFSGSDLSRPRMTVEVEKIKAHFPGFSFYGSGDKVTSIKGYLSTNPPFYNKYHVKIEIGSEYPYEIPKIWLPYETIDLKCPHRYKDGSICVMKSGQWTSTYALAFMVAKTAIWLNKYDNWKYYGKKRWPGRGQRH